MWWTGHFPSPCATLGVGREFRSKVKAKKEGRVGARCFKICSYFLIILLQFDLQYTRIIFLKSSVFCLWRQLVSDFSLYSSQPLTLHLYFLSSWVGEWPGIQGRWAHHDQPHTLWEGTAWSWAVGICHKNWEMWVALLSGWSPWVWCLPARVGQCVELLEAAQSCAWKTPLKVFWLGCLQE